ncbi:MAG: type IV secretion system DNA-binding domain-containing protein [bacterium]|nr:type IV secretion system DNA-binding domain-containing protein [bacterium]
MDNPDEITYFAETDSRHDRKKFGIKAADRSKHIYVIGKTGMGKSTLLENMAIQDIQNGHGVCFIDPHGGTAEKLLEYVPKERVDDVLYFAPFDMDYPVSFNIMEDVGANKRHLVVNGLMSVFEKIWEDAWSARMAYILQNTLLALLEYPGATLLAVNRMYTDKEFRNKVVANVTDVSVRSFWVDEYAKYTDKYAQEATPAIQNKIGQFAGNPLIRNIVGQSKSSFNLRQIMDEQKIMIVNLSKGRVGEGNARLLGSMLITKIYLAAMSRADENATSLSKLPQFYLHVDEFQSFADKSFADILSEARKYKLNLTMAHQYIEQMEEEVRDAVFGNVGTMITFRVGAYDAEILEKEFAPTFTAEDLVNLGLRQIYLKLMIDSVSSQPFSATTLPPIEPLPVSHVNEIIEHSRKTFTRPRAEVEKTISDWHEEGRPAAKLPASAPKAAIVPPPLAKPLEKKPIDVRGLSSQSVKREVPKPFPSVSLEKLKEKTDNQRKPDARRVSDLRDALKSVIGDKPTTPPRPTQAGQTNPQPRLGGETAKSGPSPEELKKILDVS